jgi:hypothetical protein
VAKARGLRAKGDGQVQSVTVAVIALTPLFVADTQWKSAALVFVCPLLAAALAWNWTAEDRGIQATSVYIWQVIEEKCAGLRYMTWT